MSAFNTLQAHVACPRCGATFEAEIQFKYGSTWQHSYSMGDRLRWGSNDVGKPGRNQVLVEGISGPCPNCGTRDLEYDLVIERDVLREVRPVISPRSTPSPDGFVVVTPKTQ